MEKLKENHSPTIHVRALGVLWIGLQGNPQASALAPEVAAARVDVKAKDDAYEEAVMRRMAGTAWLSYADAVLDGRVRQLSLEFLPLVGGKREHQDYRTLFTESPSGAMKDLATPEQARYVGHLIATLKGGGVYAPLAHHIALLEQGQADVDAAQAARSELYIKESQAQVALQSACEDARRLYNGSFARLSVLFPDRPALVESFFADL
jgi:hypothetical protein